MKNLSCSIDLQTSGIHIIIHHSSDQINKFWCKNHTFARILNNKLDFQSSVSLDKLTFDALKTHLWNAADILRGSLDANEYRQPIMTLLFLKRLNDQFEEKAEELERKGKSKKDAWEDPDRHSFFVPENARRFDVRRLQTQQLDTEIL